MALADTFTTIVESLPDDWTDLELDLRGTPDFYRRVWSIGSAGIGIPLTTQRGTTQLHLNVRSVDRVNLLKRPQAN